MLAMELNLNIMVSIAPNIISNLNYNIIDASLVIIVTRATTLHT